LIVQVFGKCKRTKKIKIKRKSEEKKRKKRKRCRGNLHDSSNYLYNNSLIKKRKKKYLYNNSVSLPL
jgi:hypothetical protein